jgi:hypothetical protein
MEHVVFFPSADGVPSFQRVESLDDAVAYVEHLRNVESITEFSVHSMTEVPLSFRAYYHVVVPAAAEDSAVSAVADEVVVDEAAPVEAVEPVESVESVETVEPAPVAVAADVPVEAPVEVAAVEVAPLEQMYDAPAVESEPVPMAGVPMPADDAAEAITMVPVEATDDDRSAEWVAEASVVEAPVDVPAPAAPVEPPVLSEPAPFLPPVQQTPFADAPPVTVPVMDTFVKDAPIAVAPAAEAGESDEPVAEAVPVPTGRRSMGFFSR